MNLAFAKVTLTRMPSVRLIQECRPVTEVTETPKLARLCEALAHLESVVTLVEEWKVEAIFTDGCGSELPVIEKDLGLRLLKLFGVGDALERWMWRPTSESRVPPVSGTCSKDACPSEVRIKTVDPRMEEE